MRIAKSDTLRGSAEEVFRRRTTPAFQEAKCAASRAERHTVSIESAPSGATIIRTERVMSTAAFPDSAKAVVGDHLRVLEVQEWGVPGADGSRRADIGLATKVGKIHWIVSIAMSGAVVVRPLDAATCEQTLDADLRANIPFLGSRIEKLAQPAIDAGFAIEVDLLNGGA